MPTAEFYSIISSTMQYYLGLDIGSVNVKLCLIDNTGRVIKRDIEKIVFDARLAINTLLGRLEWLEEIAGAGVAGSGKGIIPVEWGWGEYSSPLAVASGVLHDHPDARTIIQIGGQSSLVISLEDQLKKPWKVVSNPKPQPDVILSAQNLVDTFQTVVAGVPTVQPHPDFSKWQCKVINKDQDFIQFDPLLLHPVMDRTAT